MGRPGQQLAGLRNGGHNRVIGWTIGRETANGQWKHKMGKR